MEPLRVWSSILPAFLQYWKVIPSWCRRLFAKQIEPLRAFGSIPMPSSKTMNSNYIKTVAVIDSCETLEQCKVARKFLNLAQKATTVKGGAYFVETVAQFLALMSGYSLPIPPYISKFARPQTGCFRRTCFVRKLKNNVWNSILSIGSSNLI